MKESSQGVIEALFSRRKTVPLLLIGGLALLSHGAICTGQILQDEAEQWRFASRLIDAIPSFDLIYFLKFMALPHHPPLRYFLSIPGILLFPHSEFGLRLGAILVSLYMTYQVMQLGRELGGEKVGVVSGALIAISPVYNWTSMAFGWSVIPVVLLHCVRLLRSKSTDLQTSEGTRVFLLVNSLVIVAFLTNTGCILFFVSTGLVYFVRNSRHIGRLVKLFAPFVAFYALYYFVYFVAIPTVAASYFDPTTAIQEYGVMDFGQLQQSVWRARGSHLNYSSFKENLRGINAHFFPYVSWAFLCFATYYLIRYEPLIALWLSLYTLAWSFYFSLVTNQYFLLVFIVMVPFAVAFISKKVGGRLFAVSMVILAILMAFWNYQMFLRPYGSDDPNFPAWLIAAGKATGRMQNIKEPYDQIASDIDSLLIDGKYFVHDLPGSFTIFYYPSGRYAGRLGIESNCPNCPYRYVYDQGERCYRIGDGFDDVGIIVSDKEFCPQADSGVRMARTYPNSKIRLFRLSSPR